MSENDAQKPEVVGAPEEEPIEDLPPPSNAELEAQEKAMKDLLAGAKVKVGGETSGEKAEEPAPERPILPAVQRKIRKRSKGKFYSDGWSIEAGRVNYVLIAGVMLVVLAIAYFALGPVGVSK
jgi:hypothetical protein